MTDRSEVTHFEDSWTRIDSSADSSFFVRFLDATRARMIEAARRDPSTVLAHLELRPGLSVLDVGCGVGDLTTIVAGVVGPGGRAVGIDLSEVMIEEATRRAKAAGAAPHFERGDVQQLRFGDGEFDRVLASQLLVHVPDPARSLDELCRVTKPEGSVILGEMDWDTLVIALDDRQQSRHFTQTFSDGIRNPLIARELRGMLHARGFQNVRLLPQPMMFDDFAMAKQWILDPAFHYARRTGVLPPDEIDAVDRELSARAAEGRFFAASTFYTVIGTRG